MIVVVGITLQERHPIEIGIGWMPHYLNLVECDSEVAGILEDTFHFGEVFLLAVFIVFYFL